VASTMVALNDLRMRAARVQRVTRLNGLVGVIKRRQKLAADLNPGHGNTEHMDGNLSCILRKCPCGLVGAIQTRSVAPAWQGTEAGR
jgi:hypothetical protein